MWRITLILNALIMGVFSLGAVVSQCKLHNVCIQYPDAGEGMILPACSEWALQVRWLLATVPIVWTIGTLILMAIDWKKLDRARDVVQMHTSATLLIGLFMLLFFTAAGIMPFITFIVGMG